MDIRKVITELSTKRKIFVSEADFQFALAWEIQKQYPTTEIRLEYCPFDIDSSMHIDILVKDNRKIYPIELKYMTLGCDTVVDGEKFVLKNQGAQDTRRYDFLKDIARLEKVIEADQSFTKGYAILVTNDPSYWTAPRNLKTCDAEFRINEGTNKTGELKWAEHTGPGTCKGREKAILLKDSYTMNWMNYSKINDNRSGAFRLLCLEIENKATCSGGYGVYEN